MIFVRQLREEEIAQLKRMTRQEVGRISQRAQIVLLSAQRRTVPEIAAIFGISPATVRLWIRRFEAKAAVGLLDGVRRGRPRKQPALLEETSCA